jgi:AbrB family looped-hinge helix DNA binding protein
MNAQTKLSAKGQVVLPKAVRERLGLEPGMTLDVIDTAGGVELRPRRLGKAASVADGLARLRGIVHYEGPTLDEADWKRNIDQMHREMDSGRTS